MPIPKQGSEFFYMEQGKKKDAGLHNGNEDKIAELAQAAAKARGLSPELVAKLYGRQPTKVGG